MGSVTTSASSLLHAAKGRSIREARAAAASFIKTFFKFISIPFLSVLYVYSHISNSGRRLYSLLVYNDLRLVFFALLVEKLCDKINVKISEFTFILFVIVCAFLIFVFTNKVEAEVGSYVSYLLVSEIFYLLGNIVKVR